MMNHLFSRVRFTPAPMAPPLPLNLGVKHGGFGNVSLPISSWCNGVATTRPKTRLFAVKGTVPLPSEDDGHRQRFERTRALLNKQKLHILYVRNIIVTAELDLVRYIISMGHDCAQISMICDSVLDAIILWSRDILLAEHGTTSDLDEVLLSLFGISSAEDPRVVVQLSHAISELKECMVAWGEAMEAIKSWKSSAVFQRGVLMTMDERYGCARVDGDQEAKALVKTILGIIKVELNPAKATDAIEGAAYSLSKSEQEIKKLFALLGYK